MKKAKEIIEEVAVLKDHKDYEGFLVNVATYTGSLMVEMVTEFLHKAMYLYAEQALDEAANRSTVDKQSIIGIKKELK